MSESPTVRLDSLPLGTAFRFPGSGLRDHVRSQTTHPPGTPVEPLPVAETAAMLEAADRAWHTARQQVMCAAAALDVARNVESAACADYTAAPSAATYAAALAAFDARFVTIEPAYQAARWNSDRTWRRALIARHAHALAAQHTLTGQIPAGAV